MTTSVLPKKWMLCIQTCTMCLLVYGAASIWASHAQAAEESASKAETSASNADIAQKLSNPVASLISVPYQLNYDGGYGRTDDGYRWTLNVQPVYPISLSDNWNLISRTILPIIHQKDVSRDGRDTGLGDTTQSFYFSPVEPTESGWIWGAGPAFLLPTATKQVLGSKKWGIGPTAVALHQSERLTYGALANHIWSFAGDDDRSDVSTTFIQPFVSYTLPSATTFTANFEASRDWEAKEWAIPLNTMVSQVTTIGSQLVSLQAGFRWWLDSPSGGPDWGTRFAVVLLYPR